MLMQVRLAIEHPNGSDARSEENECLAEHALASRQGAKLTLRPFHRAIKHLGVIVHALQRKVRGRFSSQQ
jgi:hypothetical protein